MITYQDSSVTTSYIQIFLREYFGYSIKRQRKITNEGLYIISDEDYEYALSNDLIKVTGYFNPQTYSALALYMAYNYPMEGFPIVWNRDGQSWTSQDFYDNDEFINKMYETVNPGISLEDYKLKLSNNPSYKYFEIKKFCNYELEGELAGQDYRDIIISLIINNLKLFAYNKSVIEVPRRVLSYIFNEVVNPQSSGPEIIRIKQLIYGTLLPLANANYDSVLIEKVIEIQSEFIKKYTIVENSIETINLPEQYADFKVTGYIDPWTELIIKGDSDNE